MPVADEFMSRLPLNSDMRVLDVACGSGNFAVIAARCLSLNQVVIEREDGFGYQALAEFAENIYAS